MNNDRTGHVINWRGQPDADTNNFLLVDGKSEKVCFRIIIILLYFKYPKTRVVAPSIRKRIGQNFNMHVMYIRILTDEFYDPWAMDHGATI